MHLKSVFVQPLSKRIRILQAETKKDLNNELSALDSLISEQSYKSWVLETFIMGVNILFSEYIDRYDARATDLNILKSLLFDIVVKHNPDLHPDNLYITESNSISLTKTKFKLIDLECWNSTEDSSNLMVLTDAADYFKFTENARNFEHFIESEEWDLLDNIFISVRKFDKKYKDSLVIGYIPKTEDDVKYFIVVSCIDNFHQLYRYLSEDLKLSSIPFHQIIYSLYDIAVRHNPFLALTVNDFVDINSNYKSFKAGTEIAEAEYSQPQKVKKLSDVSKKTILNLEDNILKKIYGQDEEVKQVIKSIKKAYLGIKHRHTPIKVWTV